MALSLAPGWVSRRHAIEMIVRAQSLTGSEPKWGGAQPADHLTAPKNAEDLRNSHHDSERAQ
jgi:hypothetical protein